MKQYVEVSLSGDRVVRVYPVPPYVIHTITSRFPAPEVPRRPVNPEVALTPGDEIEDENDPGYVKARDAWVMQRGQAYVDARLVYGLKDELPPANWPTDEDQANWDFLQVKIEVPKDSVGRKLAWIKYGLLLSGQDMELVSIAIDSFSAEFGKEEVDRLIESFRNQSSGHTSR